MGFTSNTSKPINKTHTEKQKKWKTSTKTKKHQNLMCVLQVAKSVFVAKAFFFFLQQTNKQKKTHGKKETNKHFYVNRVHFTSIRTIKVQTQLAQQDMT